MIFGYWDRSDHDPIRAGINAWRSHFPSYRLLGDSDIEPLVAKYFPKHCQLYRSIRIPTCKSNIAELLGLYHWGGLFADIHCGIRDEKYIGQLLAMLRAFELIVFKTPGNITNRFIFARPHSEIVFEFAVNAFHKLETHRNVEKSLGYRPYDIWMMTGPGNIMETIVDESREPLTLRQRFAGKIWVLPEETAPIVKHVYYSYGKPGMHWSERQQRELLFQ
jgi:mannosyltransferase OCH1-like enzyme